MSGNAPLNAVGVSATTISVTPQQTDLGVAFVKVPQNGHSSKTIGVTIDISNTGNVTAKGALEIDFSASQSPALGGSLFALGPITKHISVKSGKTQRLHVRVPLTVGITTGNEYLVASIDPNHLFLDPNLANNIAISQSAVSVS